MVNKQIVIFGSGSNGVEALDFFGAKNVFCFVDNDPDKQGTMLFGKHILSFDDMLDIYKNSPAFAKVFFEFVIAQSGVPRRWQMFAIANQLIKAGIEDYSVLQDVRKRWRTGAEFISRDRDVYPHEQESMLEIYKHQFDYLKRHIDPTTMKPAFGTARDTQIKRLDDTVNFLDSISELDIHPIMMYGTLVGALRHRGFIPWDDDLDFCLSYAEYKRLEDHFQKQDLIFTPHFNNSDYSDLAFRNAAGLRSDETDAKYYAWRFYDGCITVLINDNSARQNGQDVCVADFACLHYFPDDFTNEAYRNTIRDILNEQESGRTADDRSYSERLYKEGFFKENSNRVGIGFGALYMKWRRFTNMLLSMRTSSIYKMIWDTKDIFPIQKLQFENTEFYAPANSQKVLEDIYGMSYMQLPPTVGCWCHDRERLFNDKY